jgi:hypothetical protein
MVGKRNAGFGRGTRLRACGAEACAAPEACFFHYSTIPTFHYSFLIITDDDAGERSFEGAVADGVFNEGTAAQECHIT